MEFARAGGIGRGSLDALDKLFNRGALADISELIGIRDAEINAVAGLEFVAVDFVAVDEGAVAAASILEHQLALEAHNLRLMAADTAVAQRQLIACLTTDAKGKRGNHNVAARTVGFHYDQSGTVCHGATLPRTQIASDLLDCTPRKQSLMVAKSGAK